MPAHPDPTFHASAKLAMQAPPEKVAYTVMLSPDFSQPDGLAVVEVDPGSKSFGKIVHTVIMPNKGDEFHHFGWNACSSALSPHAGHAFLERRYLIIRRESARPKSSARRLRTKRLNCRRISGTRASTARTNKAGRASRCLGTGAPRRIFEQHRLRP
jgi:hypothetical protein